MYEENIPAKRLNIKVCIESKTMKNWVIQSLQQRVGNTVKEYIQKKYF